MESAAPALNNIHTINSVYKKWFNLSIMYARMSYLSLCKKDEYWELIEWSVGWFLVTFHLGHMVSQDLRKARFFSGPIQLFDGSEELQAVDVLR